MAIKTELFDLRDAGRTIGPEYESEKLGHEIIELLAITRVWEVGALSASLDGLLSATRTHLAPRGF